MDGIDPGEILFFIPAFGTPDWARVTEPYQTHYFERHGYRALYQREARLDICGRAPNWWKCLAYQFAPAARFIVCFDWDIMPLPHAEALHPNLASDQLCFALDRPDIGYNSGLWGFPRPMQSWVEEVYREARPEECRFQEQDSLNDRIKRDGVPVSEIPRRFNRFGWRPGRFSTKPMLNDLPGHQFIHFAGRRKLSRALQVKEAFPLK